MDFRPDIQILRGIAVLFVVLFHLGFQSLQSGFLGVDIFFVISGFLMAVLYDHRDIKGFFIRRAKRLLPAYYTTILVTLIVSFVINTPNETNQVVSQAIYGSAFLSNVGFWSQNTYFSKAEFNPLLHLWSLGVEIQFYLAVPLLAWFFRKSRYFLGAFIVVSLALCLFVVTLSPKTSFFMMPLRVWQFLLGYGAALYLSHKGSVKYSNYSWLGLLGLLLVVSIPFLKVDGESLRVVDGHPGLIALMVTVATAFVLVFGLPRKIETNAISKGLVVLGNYSYSVYLVHFPLIVLYLSEPFAGTVLSITNKQQLIVLTMLTAALSVALHKLVETRKFSPGIWKISVFSSALIISLAIVLPVVKNIVTPEAERKVYSAFQDRAEYRCGKIFRTLNPSAISCKLTSTPSDAENNVFLVGNSHADSIKNTFARIASLNGLGVYFAVANNPLMPGGLSSQAIIDEAISKNVTHIVVHYSPAGITPARLKELVALAETKGIDVTFIDPVPTWSEHIPAMMYRQLNGSEKALIQTREDYLAKNADLFAELETISNKNFNRISIYSYLCNPDCVYKTEDGIPLYFDPGHLTLTGSRLLEGAIAQALMHKNLTSSSG